MHAYAQVAIPVSGIIIIACRAALLLTVVCFVYAVQFMLVLDVEVSCSASNTVFGLACQALGQSDALKPFDVPAACQLFMFLQELFAADKGLAWRREGDRTQILTTVLSSTSLWTWERWFTSTRLCFIRDMYPRIGNLLDGHMKGFEYV